MGVEVEVGGDMNAACNIMDLFLENTVKASSLNIFLPWKPHELSYFPESLHLKDSVSLTEE